MQRMAVQAARKAASKERQKAKRQAKRESRAVGEARRQDLEAAVEAHQALPQESGGPSESLPRGPGMPGPLDVGPAEHTIMCFSGVAVLAPPAEGHSSIGLPPSEERTRPSSSSGVHDPRRPTKGKGTGNRAPLYVPGAQNRPKGDAEGGRGTTRKESATQEAALGRRKKKPAAPQGTQPPHHPPPQGHHRPTTTSARRASQAADSDGVLALDAASQVSMALSRLRVDESGRNGYQ